MVKKIQSFITRYFRRYKGLDKFSSRFTIVSVMIGVFIVAIFLNLFHLMVADKDKNQQAAASQQLMTKSIPASRGSITDINGEKLVQSAVAWVVQMEPKVLSENYSAEEREEICRTLSEILGISYDTVLRRSYLNSNTVKLTVKADKDQKDKLTAYIYRDVYYRVVEKKDENGVKHKEDEVYFEDHPELKLVHDEHYQYIKGVTLQNDTKRYYYHDTPIAANVLGYTNFDNEGSQGLESYYNDELKGVDGKSITAKNSMGGEMPFDYNATIDPINGNSLTLTIDANIQSILEKYLRQAVIDNDVQNRAVGIIMNVNTGGILAMSTMNDYDPADYQTITDENALKRIAAIEDPDEKKKATIEAQQEQWRNKAVNDTYEPGSVFKPITLAAALEEGVTNMDDNFVCKGYCVVGKRRVHCAKRTGHGSETLTQGLMNSCNPVFMTLADRLGVSSFYKYFKSFGLTAATGIDLPGEAAGMFHTDDDMTQLDLAVSSFGQSFTVTPIQMITAISAATNGGYLVKPYIVEKITDNDGNIVKSHQTEIRRQVISAETSKKVNMMLEATANTGGTAHNVYISGYRIGAKTGTSQKIAKQAVLKNDKNLYIASFCAVAPIDDPEIAVLVMFDEPNNPKSHSGGTIVAPVVRSVLSEVLPYLGVDTVYSEDDIRLMDTIVPNVEGKSKDEAVQILEEKGFKVRVVGDGDTVTGQTPSGSKSAPKSCTVVINTGSEDGIPTTTVPDLVGLSPTSVAYEVRTKNLNIRYSGTGFNSSSGVAVSQDIPGGIIVDQGTVVTVEFTVSGIND